MSTAPSPAPAPADPHPRLTKLIKLYNWLAPLIALIVPAIGGPPIVLPTIPGGQGADATGLPTSRSLLHLSDADRDAIESQIAADPQLRALLDAA